VIVRTYLYESFVSLFDI